MTSPRIPPEWIDDDDFAFDVDRIVTSADAQPRAELTSRVLHRIAAEPRTSAPRRFLAALAALDASATIHGFGQTAATVVGGSRIPAIVRLQAMAIVLVMVSVASTVGVVGAAATLSIAEIVTSPQRSSKQQRPNKQVRSEAVVRPAVAAGHNLDDRRRPASQRRAGDGSGSDRPKGNAKSDSAKTYGKAKSDLAKAKANDKAKAKAKVKAKVKIVVPKWVGEDGGGKVAKKPVKARASAQPVPPVDAKAKGQLSSKDKNRPK